MANPVLQPVKNFSMRNGVKSVAYGPPGGGKTPLIKTAPRPVILVCEPGMLSMRDSNIPAADGSTVDKIDDFFNWLKKSNEAKKFDTVCIDSGSQMAEISLKLQLSKNKDGRKAFGEMSRHIMGIFDDLFFMPEKHIYIIAKQAIVDNGGTNVKRPYFPGQDLNVKVPHLFDCVFHIGKYNVPGIIGEVDAVRAKENFDTMARDRSGNLAELNPPNLSDIFKKCME